MKNNVWAAMILAMALILAAALNGGIYEFHKIDIPGDSTYLRINRLTSAYAVCFANEGRYRCKSLPEDKQLEFEARPSTAPSPGDTVPPGDLP
jgi:hypothetical protein